MESQAFISVRALCQTDVAMGFCCNPGYIKIIVTLEISVVIILLQLGTVCLLSVKAITPPRQTCLPPMYIPRQLFTKRFHAISTQILQQNKCNSLSLREFCMYEHV